MSRATVAPSGEMDSPLVHTVPGDKPETLPSGRHPQAPVKVEGKVPAGSSPLGRGSLGLLTQTGGPCPRSRDVSWCGVCDA